MSANVLKGQAYCDRLGMLPLNPAEYRLFINRYALGRLH
jgi:hypothetical protein